jgi:aryl-alcohol dehydrogenase-like predicted oxidoreductase
MTNQTIQRRTLGVSGPEVSAIGLGCMGMTGFYGEPDDDQCLRTLHRALDLGCSFWDSSDAYGPHTNERLLSRVLIERRPEVFVATKFGISFDPVTLKRSVDGSAANVGRSCDASLKRLGIDQIDLYYASAACGPDATNWLERPIFASWITKVFEGPV